MKMNERELSALVTYMVEDSVTESASQYNTDNENYLKYYKADPFGDEMDGRSQVVSTDTRDLVESDMPSLARVFLGANDPVEFKAVSQTRDAIQEAKDKQRVVSHIIHNIPNYFRTMHDFLKATELQKIAAIEYGCREVKTTKVKRYSGINNDELAGVKAEIEADKDVDKVDVVETTDEEDGKYDAVIRVTFSRKEYFMNGVPAEDLIISRNATNKEDADIVGKRFKKTRGQFVAEGFSKEEVDQFPSSNNEDENRTTLKQIRFDDQGGEDYDSISYVDWANQEVEGYDVYALVDYDGDGIAERRHIIKVGNKVIMNEQFDHVPYAMGSSMLMPYSLIGEPRAELTKQYQRINSQLWRGTLDNLYAVNFPRHIYTDDVDVDALLDHQFGGAIHTEGAPANSVMTLETPYVGDKNLQVVQYMEGKKTSSTGNLIANQALEADQLSDETATRFKGMEQAGAAKIELVARVLAETAIKELWEGIAWFANHYQDEELEIRVLGTPMKFDPKGWKYDHRISAKVGTGAGDDEKTLANLMGIYQIQQQLLANGSVLTDQTKLFNTLAEMVRTTGRDAVETFFNNPDQPEEIVTAERDLQKKMIEQLEANMQNPLVEMEKAKAEGQMQIKLVEQKFNAQLEMLKMQQSQEKEIAQMRADFDKQLGELQYKYTALAANTRLAYDELETANSVDIPGEGTE